MFSKLLAGSIVALSWGKALAAVQFAGVNIAGFDFGCDTTGACQLSDVDPPILPGSDGPGQMKHFTEDNGLNIYRLPVAWQYLVNNVCGGTLDTTNFGKYNELVQGCLATGSHCVIDIHNYARWNGQIIGQGGPTNDEFASLWSQLATNYAADSKVVMGIMNEPHDIPQGELATWAASVQAAVTAIRKAGATSHYILLPGNSYTAAGSFVSGGSAAALSTVKNLDGSTTNLIFDVHQYLDMDGSGTHTSCVTNHIDDAFSPLATWLRQNNRVALLSETGGGSDDSSCLTDVCSALGYLNQNSDVYLGYLGWSAGAFDSSYILSLAPSGSAASGWTDTPMLKQCIVGQFSGSSNSSSPYPVSSAATSLSTVSPAGYSPASSAAAPTTATTNSTPVSSNALPSSSTQAAFSASSLILTATAASSSPSISLSAYFTNSTSTTVVSTSTPVISLAGYGSDSGYGYGSSGEKGSDSGSEKEGADDGACVIVVVVSSSSGIPTTLQTLTTTVMSSSSGTSTALQTVTTTVVSSSSGTPATLQTVTTAATSTTASVASPTSSASTPSQSSGSTEDNGDDDTCET